ncbi:MAG: 6-phospho-beta-glucosidase, partial [Nostocoides sp.]
MKLVIVGGGGFRVPLIHRALLRAGADQPITQVELLDTDPARLHAMRRVLAQLGGPGSGPAPVVHAGTDAVTALT